ncbi:MAG: NAD(P)H-dependent oxidoreductase subunit E [Calditrichota bacterium]
MMNPGTDASYDLDKTITAIVNRYGAKPTALIMALQDIQKHYRYLPVEALKLVAQKMNLPIAQIYGVATFYKAFSLKPKGKHHICVCTGTACHVRQAPVIVDHLTRVFKIQPGETTPDGEVSIETVNCMGACALGPLVTIDEEYYGNLNVTKMNVLIDKLQGKTVHEMAEE